MRDTGEKPDDQKRDVPPPQGPEERTDSSPVTPEPGVGGAAGQPEGPPPTPLLKIRRAIPRVRKDQWPKIAAGSLLAAILLAFLGARVLTPNCEGDGCPSVDALRNYRPPEPARIFDAKGDLAGQLSGPKRVVVDMAEIPQVVRDGYIAVEDKRFREHGGVDVEGALRAFVVNLKAGGISEGGSTITMQLARNVFGPEVLEWNRFHRKLAEVRISKMIEDQLTKDEILEMYLNQIYLGDGIYGVETASEHYFGKPVSQVNVREAALLVGLAKNPEGYNPKRNPGEAQERIETVLGILEEQGVITPQQAEEARGQRVTLTEGSAAPEWGKNAYYLSGVRRELREIFPDPVVRQGLRVYTGLDGRAQAAAVDALVGQIEAIEAGRWGRFRHEAATDSLEKSEASPYLQGMAVAMDVRTGLVTTLVGGRDYEHSEFDRAFQARRQPGSAFKPIVYAVALANGMRLTDRFSTQPVKIDRVGTPTWEPGDHVTAEELSMRDGLVYSSNTVTVRIGQQVGVQRVVEEAHALGLSTDIPNYPSVLLGAADVIPAELVAAYAAFGNGGRKIEPHFITRVEDANGRVVYERRPSEGSRVLDPRVAFLVLDMMRDVTRRGTGWRVGASGIQYPTAGKTGTTNDTHDAWFIGMTPSVVGGVWLGFDDPQTIVKNATGGDLAAPVWAQFMAVAGGAKGANVDWQAPPGVVAVAIDPRTGFRSTDQCPVPGARTEYFLGGTEPFDTCPMYDPYYDYSDSIPTYDPYWWDTISAPPTDTTGNRYKSPTIFWPGGVDTYPTPVDTVRMPATPGSSVPTNPSGRTTSPRTYPMPVDTVRMRPMPPAQPATPPPTGTLPDTAPAGQPTLPPASTPTGGAGGTPPSGASSPPSPTSPAATPSAIPPAGTPTAGPPGTTPTTVPPVPPPPPPR